MSEEACKAENSKKGSCSVDNMYDFDEEEKEYEKNEEYEEYSGNKKIVSACIMDILEKRTDREHPVSINEIVRRLPEYGCSAQRKAVSDHLSRLIDVFHGTDKEIHFQVSKGKNPNRNNFYISQKSKLSSEELDFLIPLVRSVPFLSEKRSKTIIGNLINSGARRYRTAEGYFREFSFDNTGYEDFIGNLKVISDSIRNKSAVSFDLMKKFKKCESIKEILFYPCNLSVCKGRFYVFGCEKGENKIKHYPMDRIKYVRERNLRRPDINTDIRCISDYVRQHPDMETQKYE